MKNGYYGSIDIGTNAARMVIKNVSLSGGKLTSFKVQEVRVPLRLGADVFRYGIVKEKKLDQLVKTISCFKALMEIYDVLDYEALATSALREAQNGKEVIQKVKEETGVQIEIISGEREANTISKIGADLKLEDGKYVFVDVGGGSTEITIYVKGHTVYSQSFPLGTLRILAKADKEESWSEMRRLLRKYREEYGKMDIVGTGGNINRYWKMSGHKDKKGLHVLSVKDLEKEYKTLKDMDVTERMSKFKLKPDRADVIIPAGYIFLLVADTIDAEDIIVPLVGLGDGIVDSLIQRDMNVI